MKKLIMALVMVVMLSGCTERTEYGFCIGAFAAEKPELHYKLSIWNIFVGFVFAETFIVPIVVFFDQAKCPVGFK